MPAGGQGRLYELGGRRQPRPLGLAALPLQAMKGKKLSAAHCAKISEARKGKKRSAGDMCQYEQGKEGQEALRVMCQNEQGKEGQEA